MIDNWSLQTVTFSCFRYVECHMPRYWYHISDHIYNVFFINPRPVLAFGYCRCLRLSVHHTFFLPTSRGPFHYKDTIAHHYKNHLTIAGNPIMAISLFYNQPAYPHKCISCAGKMPKKNFCVLHHVMAFESLVHLYIWTWSGDLQSCVCHHPVLTIYGLTCFYRQCL